MQTMHPTQQMLADAIEQATRLALGKLFGAHKEDFYYVALLTTGAAHAPYLSAWSKQALAAEVRKQGHASDDLLKWSLADSPYAIFGEDCFDEVKRLFGQRPAMHHELTDAQWDAEYGLRLDAMEAAMRRLDEQGMFGGRNERAGCVINVEVVPPDGTNTERAIRLNPPEALVEWLAEAAE